MFQNNGSDSFEMIHWNSSTAAQKSKFTNIYLLTFSNLIETSVVIYDFTEAALCICSTKFVLQENTCSAVSLFANHRMHLY